MDTLLTRFRSLLSPRTVGLLTAVLLVSSIFVPEVQAQEAIGSITKMLTPIGDGLGQGLAIASVYITIGVVYISTIFAILLGDLMDSTYIMGSGMGETLHAMWTVVRNFVNIGFIIILLVMAIMVILGIGQEGGTGMLKKSLPAFIIALIAVNFTFFGARLVLTASDVLSSAIFTIPSSVSMTTNASLRLPCESDSRDITACMNARMAEAGKTFDKTDEAWVARTQKQVEQWFKYMDSSHTTNFLRDGFDKKTGMFAMLTHMLSMTNLLEVSATGGIANAGGTGGDLFVNGLFSIVISIATGVVIFALAVGMIVRVAILWITIAISPLIALGYVLKEMFQFEAGSDFDPMKEFLTHAFLPVFVAIPLAIGFTMILTGHALTLHGDGLSSIGESTSAFNNIIWWIASLLVIWFGTFKAAAKSEYVSAVTEKIKGGAEGMFGAAAGTLKYLPVIPGVGSVSSVMRQPELMQNHFREQSQEQARQLGGWGGGGAARDAVGNFARMSDGASHQKMLKTDGAAGYLLDTENGQANQARHAYLSAHGVKNIGEAKDMSTGKFQQILDRGDATKGIDGMVNTKQLGVALQAAKNAKETPEQAQQSYATDTGITAAKAGTKFTGTAPADGVGKLDDIKVRGQVTQKVENADGTYTVVMKDGDQHKVVFESGDIDSVIGKLDNEIDPNEAGTAMAGILGSLAKSKAALSTTQQADIKQKIEKMFTDQKVHQNHVDDLRTAYEKVFAGDGQFINDLRDKAV